jgi:hypothetical protein
MRIAADENFDNDILRGLKRRYADLDIVRIQDTDAYRAADERVLEWSAREGRVLLTHDRATMPDAFYARMTNGLTLPGVLICSADPADIGAVLDDLSLMIEVDDPRGFEERIRYLPLK